MFYSKRNFQNREGGFTLLEVLIATAVTLLLMLGLSQVFKVLGDSITRGRGGLELNNRLRNVVHRIRTDLENVTVTPTPPIAVGTAQGYMKYYDGPISDYTFSIVDPATGQIDVTKFNTLLSRFGDVDDIFMATIKAKDAWFNGKVPRFVLEGRTGAAADANGNGIADDLADLVTISSQYAEVVMFVEPLVSNIGNANRNPAFLAVDPSNNFEDVFSGTSFPSDGIPDSFRLHYRVLLIRPDLNLVNGQLPNFPSSTPTNPLTRAMVAGPESLAPYSAVNLPTPTCDMCRIHQYCDLSIRRINDFDDNTIDPVAANSLEDLANPANRFAHVQYTLSGGAAATNKLVSMPVLALSSSIPEIQGIDDSSFAAGAGFLHPAFTLMGSRSGEDVLATDVLAFDVRAYDSSAPILDYAGGIDEQVLRPGDPGYYIFGVSGLTSSTSTIVSYGEFVDLDWTGKGMRSIPPGSVPPSPITSLFSGSTTHPTLVPSLTNHQTRPIDPSGISDSLLKSGLCKFAPNSNVLIFQPAYDTFTDSYESDGIYQAQLAGPFIGGKPRGGTAVWLDGWIAGAEAWRTSIDEGNDGIDNELPGDGVADDIDESETSAPFVVDLRGLQISVRLEDRATKQFKQMSTIKEFVTH